MKVDYIYDAFISYRHSKEEYKRLAREIQTLIEKYKPPKSLKDRLLRKVFLDQSDFICEDIEKQEADALRLSKFLIVLSSPDYTDSKNTLYELNQCLASRSNDIIVTLIDGSTSKNLEDLQKAGLVSKTLAADIRPNSKGLKSSIKKLKTTEIFKILAKIMNCDADDLIQREKKRKRSFALAVFGISVFITAMIAVGFLTYKHNQRQEAIATIKQNVVKNLDKTNRSLEMITPYFKYQGIQDIRADGIDLTRESNILSEATAQLYQITAYSDYKLDTTTYYESISDIVKNSKLTGADVENLYYSLQRLGEHYITLQDKLLEFRKTPSPENYELLMLMASEIYARSSLVYYRSLMLFPDIDTSLGLTENEIAANVMASSQTSNDLLEEYLDKTKDTLDKTRNRVNEYKDDLAPKDGDDKSALINKATKLRSLGKREQALEVYDYFKKAFGDEEGMDGYIRVAVMFTKDLDLSSAAYVWSIAENSMGREHGIREYDIIVSYNGQLIESTERLIETISGNDNEANEIRLYRNENNKLVPYVITVPKGALGIYLIDI